MRMKNVNRIKDILKTKSMLLASWSCNIKDYYQYRDWRPFLEKTFEKLTVFSPRDNYFQYGKDDMNRQFIKLVEKEKPDFILFSFSYDEFYLDTLEKIRKVSPKTIILNFFGDDDWRYDDWSRYYANYIDYSLTAKKDLKEYRRDGIKNASFFWGVNTSVIKPLNLKKKYDVTFIGGPVADRYEYIKYIKEKGINIKLFGPGWSNYEDLKDIYGGFLGSEDFVKKINESKINISFTKTFYEKGKTGQFKGRLFDVAACKSFQLVEDSYTLFGPFHNNKINFANKEELLKKIDYYLKNEKERESIAEQIYNYVINNFTWENQFMKIFENIFKYKNLKHKLPIINKYAITLNEKDLQMPLENLKKKTANYSYVIFSDKYCINDKKRIYTQIYSLEKSKRDISCCDYYVYSPDLGNYLLFSAKRAFNLLDDDKFSNFVSLNQLMVSRKYFIKNLSKFKNLANGKDQNIISKYNTIFVSIPLVSIGKLNRSDYKSMESAFQMKFRDRLYSLIYQKKILITQYMYKLIFLSFSQPFILRYLFKEIFTKENWLKIKGKL